MKKVRTGTILSLLFVSIWFNAIRAEEVNFLDQAVFTFEDGGAGIYYQQTATYWSVSSDRSAGDGSYSLKFTSSEPVTSTQKAKYGTSDKGINLPAGDYTFKFKVWLGADADIKGFAFNVKTPWKSFPFNLDTIVREEWVELSTQATFDTDIVNSGCIIRVDSAHIGNGTMYLDDFGFWGEKPPEPVELPLISSIETTDSANLNLPSGVYDVRMKLWKDPGTTISTLYTTISEPWSSMQWDFDTLTEGQWSTLSNELIIRDTAMDATFTLQVNNNPEFGGGTGTLFIDDIEFIKKRDYVPVSTLSLADSSIILNAGETYGLDHVLQPINATDTAVIWMTSDASVATVDPKGVVTALDKGETTITVFSTKGYISASCQVEVEVRVEGITLSESSITLQIGEQYRLYDTIRPVNADNQDVEWASGSDTIASVVDGVVTGLSAGTTIISVTTEDGNYTAQCTVTVSDTTTSLSELNANKVQIMPNPFTNRICIETGEEDFKQLQLYSLSGEMIMNRNISGEKTIWLNPSYEQVPAGMYLLRVIGEEGVKSARVVRE